MIQYSGITTHNLKGIDFSIKENSIVLLKGCSGSGKSSLAIDTIYRISDDELCQLTNRVCAKSQYDVCSYSGIIPSICLQQENYNVNPRSTIGTYFRLNSCLANVFANECCLSREVLNFNNSDYYCPHCRGLGSVLEPSIIDSVDESLPIAKRPFRIWNVRDSELYNQLLVLYCKKARIPTDIPLCELSKRQLELLYFGESREKFKIQYRSAGIKHSKTLIYKGAIPFLREIIEDAGMSSVYKMFYHNVNCPMCHGGRLSPDLNQYMVCGRSLCEYQTMEFSKLSHCLHDIVASEKPYVANQFNSILRFVDASLEMRLGYLNINRSIPSLSGGELQRLSIAKASVSHFNGFLYVFDEPTSALHPSEWSAIVESVKEVRKRGNTVLLIDHSSALEPVADEIVHLGPGSGENGGRIVDAYGSNFETFTSEVKSPFKGCRSSVRIGKAVYNNVEISELDVPMGTLVGVCGVSGSGKTSFAQHILPHFIPGLCYVNQEPIRGNSYSMVATALDVMKDLIDYWSKSTKTQRENYDYIHCGRGQCKVCSGTGRVVERSAHYVTEILCPECHGARYSKSTLRIRWKGLNICEFLNKSIDEMIEFLPSQLPVVERLKIASAAGLGYLKMSQKTETLSGGEAQRVKIVAHISRGNRGKAYALDEPFRGVDPKNALKLMRLIISQIESGASVFLVEHNPAVLSCCSYIMEFGPGSGCEGGKVIYCGLRSKINACRQSNIKRYLIG